MTYIDVFKNIADSNPADVITSIISAIFLLGVTIFINERYRAKMRVPVPVQLIIVAVSTIVSHFANLGPKYGLAVVGDIPLGLPAPMVPNTEVMGRIVVDSFIIAILIFTLTISLAKLMGEAHNYSVDADQELVAYGMSNFVGSFFLCIATCTAPPRTMILNNTGAKSTLNAVVIIVFILVVLMVAGQLFVSLPVAVLAVMIATAVKNLLLQITQLPAFWRVSKPDFCIWVITFVASVFGDLDIGIAVGVGISILTVIVRSQLVSGSVGGLSKKEDIVLFGKNPDVYKECKNIKVFYFPSQLFFANAERFSKELFSKALNPALLDPMANGLNHNKYDSDSACSEKIVIKQACEEIKFIILDCSAMTFIDFAGANMLKRVSSQYQKVGVTLMLARCPTSSLNVLDRAEYFKTMDRNTVFFDVHDAVTCIQQGYVSYA